MQAKLESQRRQLQADFDDIPNVRLCFPSMEGQVTCMHSKLMLLFYNTHLRLVVPTANLVPYDWGETGVMENTVFLIDLPKIEGSARSGDRLSTSFKTSLMCYLKATGLPDDVLRKVCEHDFLQTAKIGFVHTIGGAHLGNNWKLTGLCGLGRTLDGLGLRTSQDIKVDFITSSIGSLNEEFLRSIYLAAQGDDGLSEYTLRNSTKLPTFVADDTTRRISKETGAKWKTNFRFYYPSDATVRESKGGPDSAGTICFNERWWNGAKFPQRNMLDCVSRRPGMLMHNKVSLATP
jgi:Tyrosyl-DNA phosphodiesterase